MVCVVNSLGKWTGKSKYQRQEPGNFRPGKTAEERRTGVHSQHLANKASKAMENRRG